MNANMWHWKTVWRVFYPVGFGKILTSWATTEFTRIQCAHFKVNTKFSLSTSDKRKKRYSAVHFNPLKPELNPICYLQALLAHHFLHVSRIRVKSLTFRRLMSYIYIYMEHPFLMFLDHTQRRSTFGRAPLDEWSARRRDLYLTTHDTQNRQISMPPVGFEPKISAGEQPAAARLLRSWIRIPPGA